MPEGNRYNVRFTFTNGSPKEETMVIGAPDGLTAVFIAGTAWAFKAINAENIVIIGVDPIRGQ